ncbi:Flp pilus assembly protein CpaB [Nocardioides limicola]|uniref:Flp pilus assembly protein CpaB n=1 Tax=Nocardioides limicola TaxID=2803368 RepID=UPI00193B50C4|nr:Flp pilus assembly protein CpaB [Nocardioides sp. DJM-14]
MDRRKVLLLVAAVIAALGTLLVFLYARGADTRAEERFNAQEVLRVVTTIEPGESIDVAQRAGKLQLQPVPSEQILPGALTSTTEISGQVALTRIFPGEQLIPGKFGAGAEGASAVLQIPEGMIAMSVNLTDPARVAGFVSPSSEVAIFVTRAEETGSQGGNQDGAQTTLAFSRLLLDRVQVLGVGSTTPITTTVTTEDGGTVSEQLPRTLITLAVTKEQAEKILLAQEIGQLAFGLTTESSELSAGPGATIINLF